MKINCKNRLESLKINLLSKAIALMAKRKFVFLLLILLISSCLKDRTFPLPVSPPTGTLVINEFMATETLDYGDEFGTGAGSDWIEIYNGTDTTVTMGANQWYMSDTIGQPNKYLMPATVNGHSLTIASKNYLVVYCDGLDSTKTQIHTSFKLSHTSGDVVLYYKPTVGAAHIVDSYTYGLQVKDITWGRLPNGGSNWTQCTKPTPGYVNQ